MNINNHYLFLTLILLVSVFILSILIFTIIVIFKYTKNKYINKLNSKSLDQFAYKVFEDRLETTKKLIEICLVHKSTNSKVIQQYGQVVNKDILGYYLNLDIVIQTIDVLHDNFSNKIEKRFPYLTKKDIHLCSLIKAKFQTYEIAALLSHQEDSIRTMKVRLRSKMKFRNQEEFISYIDSI